jgi:hypothetical protein
MARFTSSGANASLNERHPWNAMVEAPAFVDGAVNERSATQLSNRTAVADGDGASYAKGILEPHTLREAYAGVVPSLQSVADHRVDGQGGFFKCSTRAS